MTFLVEHYCRGALGVAHKRVDEGQKYLLLHRKIPPELWHLLKCKVENMPGVYSIERKLADETRLESIRTEKVRGCRVVYTFPGVTQYLDVYSLEVDPTDIVQLNTRNNDKFMWSSIEVVKGKLPHQNRKAVEAVHNLVMGKRSSI